MTSPTLMTPGSSAKDATLMPPGSSTIHTTQMPAGESPTLASPMTSGPSLTPPLASKPEPIMGKTLGLLATLLLAQLALATFLFIRGNGFGTVQPDEALVTFEPTAVDRVTIQDDSGTQVELVKRDGQWRLPGHFDFPASTSKVEALLKDLQGLRTRLPVSTSPEAFARFKVAADQFERRIDLRQGDQELAVLYLGDSPGFKRLFARGGQGEAVFEVAYAAHQAGAKANDWTDKGLFALTPDQMAGLSLNGMVLKKVKAEDGSQDPKVEDKGQDRQAGDGDQSGQLGQDRWVMEGENTEIDQAKAGDLARAAASLNYLEVLGTEAMPAYQMDNPVARLTVQPREGKPREFLIAKLPDSEDYVLKASDHPWYFKVGAWAVKGLQEASKETLLVTAVAAPDPGRVPIEPAAAHATAPTATPDPAVAPAPADDPAPIATEPPAPVQE